LTQQIAKIGHDALGRVGQGRGPVFGALALRLRAALSAAYQKEAALRRPFLWTPVAAGAGALLYFVAEHEPSLPFALALFILLAFGAWRSRANPRFHIPLLLLACVSGGFFSAVWRAARVDAPIVPRTGVGQLTGYVEELDLRRGGARFVLRVASAEGLPGDAAPTRVRLTMRGEPGFKAGDFIALKARLLPPAHASLPGSYNFARDAYFMGIGAVGSTLGRIETMPPPDPAPFSLRFGAAIDRARNALALRVYNALEGDAGAIAAAMVTGKRDFLSESAKEMIRRAGIFHIVTISGIQMSLVAGIFFVGLRRILSLSQTLALHYPIKKWAAALAILGAAIYDIFTGSRVGTERALVMTLAMLLAVLLDRAAFSMRNLAWAAFFVVIFEPEALLGASFQLSFAAVGALIAVYEAKAEARNLDRERAGDISALSPRPAQEYWLARLKRGLLLGPGAALFATFCATSATASFMANDFHEISPYVLVGNPLTLAIIEFFAVPAALLGAALYPLGLDGLVWSYLGLGIDLVVAIAKLIGSAPGASLPVKSFAPWAIFLLALALLFMVLWRSWTLRAFALPLALLGLLGASSGPGFDLAVAPSGESAAVRLPEGGLTLLGSKPGAFAAEQWLRADADSRAPGDARGGVSCDSNGCVARALDGRYIALVEKRAALIEDCAKAAIVVTPLYAPSGCGAPIVIDRRKLEETGAIALRLKPSGIEWSTARSRGEDRPWSKLPPGQKIFASSPEPNAGGEGELADFEE
jgi:competence protein ComEC